MGSSRTRARLCGAVMGVLLSLGWRAASASPGGHGGAAPPAELPSPPTPEADRTSPEGHPGHDRWMVHSDLVGRYNPEGVALIAGGIYRRVYAVDDARGDASSYIQAGLGGAVNPANGQVFAHVEWMPKPFLLLRFQYDLYAFFGANGGLLSFASGDAPFGREVISGRKDARTATGHRVMLQPTLRAKLGPVVMLSRTDVAYHRFGGAGPYFYEQEYDTLLKDADLLVANRTQVMLELWQGGRDAMLLTGPYYEVTHAASAELTRQRAGLALFWTPADTWGVVRRPRAYAMAGVNAQDRNRQGQPHFGMGIGGDLDL